MITEAELEALLTQTVEISKHIRAVLGNMVQSDMRYQPMSDKAFEDFTGVTDDAANLLAIAGKLFRHIDDLEHRQREMENAKYWSPGDGGTVPPLLESG